MWILGTRPPVRCNAPDSSAGQALRTGGALLIGVWAEGGAQVIVTSKQAALITHGQRAVGELMDDYRAAYEMQALAGRRQLQDEVFEGNGVVVAHHPFILARQHQLQFDARQLDEGAFGLRRFDGEAAVEVWDEVLLQIVVGGCVIVNALMSEFLWQSSLNGAEGPFAAAARLG
jgi:hypothetical protein